jgi:hypothetical protein
MTREGAIMTTPENNGAQEPGPIRDPGFEVIDVTDETADTTVKPAAGGHRAELERLRRLSYPDLPPPAE